MPLSAQHPAVGTMSGDPTRFQTDQNVQENAQEQSSPSQVRDRQQQRQSPGQAAHRWRFSVLLEDAGTARTSPPPAWSPREPGQARPCRRPLRERCQVTYSAFKTPVTSHPGHRSARTHSGADDSLSPPPTRGAGNSGANGTGGPQSPPGRAPLHAAADCLFVRRQVLEP